MSHHVGAAVGLVAAFALVHAARFHEHPIPQTVASEVPDIQDARRFADAPASSFRQEARTLAAAWDARTPATYLALSGGGPDGAYGAGVLNGWTAAGTRPEFTIVSGVSVAHLSPLRFSCAVIRGELREIYTGGLATGLLCPPEILKMIFGSSLYGNRHLRELIAPLRGRPAGVRDCF
jgi:hypothetical protein